MRWRGIGSKFCRGMRKTSPLRCKMGRENAPGVRLCGRGLRYRRMVCHTKANQTGLPHTSRCLRRWLWLTLPMQGGIEHFKEIAANRIAALLRNRLCSGICVGTGLVVPYWRGGAIKECHGVEFRRVRECEGAV